MNMYIMLENVVTISLLKKGILIGNINITPVFEF
jgi:hypothetical protein